MPVPVAFMLKLVLVPVQIVLARGCVVTCGSVFTVNVTAFDTASGRQVPFTVHLYILPFSATLAAVICNSLL